MVKKILFILEFFTFFLVFMALYPEYSDIYSSYRTSWSKSSPDYIRIVIDILISTVLFVRIYYLLSSKKLSLGIIGLIYLILISPDIFHIGNWVYHTGLRIWLLIALISPLIIWTVQLIEKRLIT